MNNQYSKIVRIVNRLLYIGSAAMMMAALVLSVAVTPAAASNSGAIWTTASDCGTDGVDLNHYNVGDHVYIHYKDFAAGTYSWEIQQISGNPKPTVATGSIVVDSSGKGCFDAHTIQPSEAGHEYSVNFGAKNDNYQVDSYTAPTSTFTPTATNTVVPSATATFTPTATATEIASATATFTPTATTTEVASATATFTPTATATEVASATATDTPTATATNEPRVTDTPVPTATEGGGENPTPTPTVVIPVTGHTPLEPLSIQIDPFCTVNGDMQWTVENPNKVSVTMYSFSVDGGTSQPGFPVHPGEYNLTTTSTGTHTVVILYGEAQKASLTATLAVCPLPIPVTGSTTIIPVTGADQTGSLSGIFLMSGFSLAGLGLILTSLRKIFHF